MDSFSERDQVPLLELDEELVVDQLDDPPELLHVLDTVLETCNVSLDPFLVLLLKELASEALRAYFVALHLHSDDLIAKKEKFPLEAFRVTADFGIC